MYTTIEEAQRERLDLVERVNGIDVQLAERAVTKGGEEYLEWRARALRARYMMTTKLRRIKVWISEQREKEAKERSIRRGGDDGLLYDLYSLVKNLVRDGVDLSRDEQALLDDVSNYLSIRKEQANG